MTRQLIIIGTGGNALDFLDIVDAINRESAGWALVGLLDDTRPIGSDFHDVPVVGRLSDAVSYQDAMFVCAIGSDQSFRRRREIIASTGLSDASFATLVHPGASVSSRSRLGTGTVVNFGVCIAGEVDLGRHVCVGPNCTIGHNSTVGDYSVLAPAAVVSGHVRIGASAYIGAAASLRQKTTIGERSLVGMGAVVVGDVSNEAIVVGNPARVLPSRAEQMGVR